MPLNRSLNDCYIHEDTKLRRRKEGKSGLEKYINTPRANSGDYAKPAAGDGAPAPSQKRTKAGTLVSVMYIIY